MAVVDPAQRPEPGEEPPRGGLRGCLATLGAVLAAAVLLLVVAVVVGWWWLDTATDRLVGDGIGPDCPFVSDAAASEALGERVDVVSVGTSGGMMLPVLDARLLRGEPSCWATAQAEDGPVARIAVADSAAGPGYDAAVQAATTAVPRFAGAAVDGVGDTALCTLPDPAGFAGVLVRAGEQVLYVSVGRPGSAAPSGPPSGGVTPSGASQPDRRGASAPGCSDAVRLARAVLGEPAGAGDADIG